MLKKRTLLLTATAALALQFTAKANDIEPGKEYYTAIKAPNPIVLDGDLSEWKGAQLLADPRFSIPKGSARDGEVVFFEEYNGGSWTGPDDQTSAVQVVYDDDNVYFGFTVTDDYHENAANSAWNGDSVQLMIANEARDQQIALYNYALGGVEGETGDVIVMHEAGPATAADAELTEAVVVRNEETKRTYYEIKLPKSTLALDELKGGVRFGLGMAINDGDEDTPGQKGWGGLGAHSIVFGKSPSETAVVTLATSNDIEPGKEFYTANPVPGALDTKTGALSDGSITLDGDLSEWKGIPVLADPRFSIPKGSKRDGTPVLFEEYNGGSWTGPDDQTSAVQIAYDASNVYFGFVVTDDYHENAANSAWNGDSVQLMIASANQDQQIALYNYALGGIENETGDVIVMHEAGPAAAADAEAVTEAVIVRDERTKRTTYEIKLPKSTLGLETLELGTQFGLGMAINDGDEDTPGQKGWGGLGAHSIVFGKSPSETALVTLGIGGAGGGGIFLSSTGADINSFFFRASDKDDSKVDPASAKLTINGQVVALEASDKKVDAYDFTYTIDGRFDPNTKLDYVIEISDTLGKTISDSGTVTTPAYGLLLGTMLATDVDTSKPGFNFNVWQSDQYNHGNTLANVEALLEAAPEVDGATIANDAYADEAGPASDAGELVGHMMHYEIPTVLNLNGYANQVDLGNFQPDDVMPGIPGNFGYYDGIAAEIVTFIEFPEEGLITMGVNSDDGFQLTMGAIGDKANATVAAKAAGVSDTKFIVDVREAGIYPVRIVYYSQAGDAGIELYTENEAGEKVLVNANGGLKAYRAGTAPEFVAPPQSFSGTPVAQGADVSEPTVVNFGDLGNQATYEFFFNAVMDGASTAIAGNNAFAIKLDQWNNQGVFGTTQFGVADNLFEAVAGQSVASVFGAPVHVVIATNADGSSLYINGTLSGTWAGNFDLSGDTKVMGARLEQATDHMGAGSKMYKWATYTGVANSSQVMALYNARPDIGGGSIASVALVDGNVVIEYTGTLKSSATVNGAYAPVAGAASPYSIAPDQSQAFFIAE
jgi:ribosomal protein L14